MSFCSFVLPSGFITLLLWLLSSLFILKVNYINRIKKVLMSVLNFFITTPLVDITLLVYIWQKEKNNFLTVLSTTSKIENKSSFLFGNNNNVGIWYAVTSGHIQWSLSGQWSIKYNHCMWYLEQAREYTEIIVLRFKNVQRFFFLAIKIQMMDRTYQSILKRTMTH